MDKKPARQNDSGENETDNVSRSAEPTQEEEATDSQSEEPDSSIGNVRRAGRSGSVQASTVSGAPSRQESHSRSSGSGYVNYDRGPDPDALSARYGLEVGGKEAGRLQQLEGEFGSERVQRWADEGMPVEAMGKPRDMQAFRKSGEEEPADEGAGADTGTQTGAGVRLQAKLEVSSPDDPAEKEAEEVAEKVTEMDISTDKQTESEQTQREPDKVLTPSESVGAASGGAVSDDVEAQVRSGVRGSGKPLPSKTQANFESKMRADFSDVTIHTGAKADAAAKSINAEAYTIGSSMAFAEGNYNPDSGSGQKLLAHELTHVAQQSESGISKVSRQSGDGDGRGTQSEGGGGLPEYQTILEEKREKERREILYHFNAYQQVPIPGEQKNQKTRINKKYKDEPSTDVWINLIEDIKVKLKEYTEMWMSALTNVQSDLSVNEMVKQNPNISAEIKSVLKGKFKEKVVNFIKSAIKSAGPVGQKMVEMYSIGKEIYEGVNKAQQKSNISGQLSEIRSTFANYKSNLEANHARPQKFGDKTLKRAFSELWRMAIYDVSHPGAKFDWALESARSVRSALNNILSQLGKDGKKINQYLQKPLIDAIVNENKPGNIRLEVHIDQVSGLETTSGPKLEGTPKVPQIIDALENAVGGSTSMFELGYPAEVKMTYPQSLRGPQVTAPPTSRRQPYNPMGEKELYSKWEWDESGNRELVDWNVRTEQQRKAHFAALNKFDSIAWTVSDLQV